MVRLFGGRIRFEKYTRNKWLQWVGFLIATGVVGRRRRGRLRGEDGLAVADMR